MADHNLNDQLDGLFSDFGNIFEPAAEPETRAAPPPSPTPAAAPRPIINAELETVAAISDLTATVFDPDDLLDEIADLIRSNFDVAKVGIYFLNKDAAKPAFILTATSGYSDTERNARGRIAADHPHDLIAQMARDHTGIIEPSKDNISRLAVPMTIVDHIIGALEIQADAPDAFIPEQLPIFKTIAAQIVVASQNIRLLHSSEDQSRRLILLNEMGTALNMTVTLDQALSVSAKFIGRIVHSARAGIALIPPKQEAWVELHTFDGETGKLQSKTSMPLVGTMLESAIKQKTLVGIPFLTSSKYVDCRQLAAEGFLSTMAAPLVLGQQVIGVLSVSSKSVNAYDIRDEEMLLHIASFLASTIHNRRLFNQIQTAFTEAEILYETSADIVIAQSYDEILEAVYRYTRLGEDPIDVGLYFFDQPKTDEQKPNWVLNVSAITEKVDVHIQPRLSYELFASMVDALDTERPLVLERVSHNGKLHHMLRGYFGGQLGASTLLVVPLVVGGKVVGFITGSYSQSLTLTDSEARRLMSLAGQAAVATQNLYTLHLTEQQTRELASVNKVLREVSRQLDMEHVLETVYQEVRRIVPAEAFYVALYDQAAEMLSFPLVYDGGKTRKLPDVAASEHDNIYRVLTSGEPLLISRTPDEVADIALRRPETASEKGEPSATLLFVPLMLGDHMMGVMSVQSYQFNAYTEREVMLMNSMANHLAVAIQNARLYRQAQVRARRETILREVTTKIRGAADVDSVLRVSAEQLNRVLGRQAFVQLRNERMPNDATG